MASSPAPRDLARPGPDVPRRRRVALLGAAHVVRQRAAAARALRDHHLAAVPGQEADGRVVDARVEHPLRAAGQAAPRACAASPRPGRPAARPSRSAAAARGGRARAWRRSRPGNSPGERPRQPRRLHRQPEAPRIGQHLRQRPAQRPLGRRAAVGALDVFPGVVDEVHVVHPGRAGGHAGEAGEAAVDMLDGLGVRRAALLQHVLDQVDAPPRANRARRRAPGRSGRWRCRSRSARRS